jgi:hypothetical protein
VKARRIVQVRLHRLQRFADPPVVECAGGNKVACASSTGLGCADR